MPELQDLINDIPTDVEEQDTDTETDEQVEESQEVEEEQEVEETDPQDDEEASEDEQDDEVEDDDYITNPPEEDVKPPETTAPVTPTDEGKYILDGLQKIAVRIVAADDSIKTVEVYGWGDLPRDMKGFPTPYEQGVFQSAVTAQELKARELQGEFRQKQANEQTQEFERRENHAIADDLTELRQEGLFPKFKGKPGTKEFEQSDGGKEFDRVVSFMNDRNDRYLAASKKGKAYRHIGFREAFDMLHGPDPKATEKAEDTARRKVAKKLVSAKGTSATKQRSTPRRVNNLTDLISEFEQEYSS